jgi:hypothetical protein
MENFDIAIVTSYHQDVLAADWFFTIQDFGKKCVIITPNPNEAKALSKQGVKVIYLKKYFPKHVPSQKEIKKYFDKLDIKDLDTYVSTEKSYYQESNNYLSKYAFLYANAFDELFKSISVKTILHPVQGGEIIRRTAALIAAKHSLNVIYLGETFIPGTVNLYADEYRTVLKPTADRKLSEEQAQKIINDKINRKEVVHYETEKRKFVSTPLPVKILNLVKDGNWNIIRAYIMRKKVISIDYLIRETYTTLAGFFKPFNPDDNYFYLPFNVQAESEIYIRNLKFADQAATVENLAKTLPAGYKLYVKIHPGIEGHLPIDYYKRLSKIKNVVPLSGKVNSFDVVKNSKGVIMVSSTVGQESYIMGKPTCILGHWPYSDYGNFIRVTNLSEAFPRLLEHAIPNDPIRFLQNVYRESVDGSIYAGAEDFKTLVKSIFTMTYLAENSYANAAG